MPQNPKLPLLKCSMCGYSSKNHFIFGRHHQRCLRENGLSNIQSSTPAKEKNDSDDDLPLKVKSDLSKVTILPEGDLPHISKGESDSRVKDVLGKTSLAIKEPLVSGTALENELVLDHVSLPKPEVDSEHKLIPNDKVSLDTKIIFKTKLTSTESEASIPIPSSEQNNSILIENSESQQLDAEGTEQNPSTSAANGETLPPPNVSRNYRCGQCSFATTKSKAFLYHQIDNHRARIYIYPCSFCEYASRYKHKLARHVTFAHKKQVSMNEMLAENTKPRALVRQKQMVFAAHKMIKSKRITVGRSSTKKKTLDAMLLKLKGKIKISDASLSAFCTDLSTQQKWDKTDSSSGNSQQDMYKCKLCLFTGKSKNHVMRHVYACHVNARLFRCNLCNYKTHSQIEFYAHKNKHSTKNATVFKCTECSYATDFKPNFERHNNNHGSNKPNKCSLCNYATDHEGALKRHVTSHHPNTAENLSLIAGDNQESVLDVPKVPESQEDEDGLELESDGFRCPICNLAYRRCADLNRHMKSKHNIRRKDFFDDQGEGEWPEDIEPVDPAEDGERIDLENVGLDTKDELTEKEEDEESRPLADLLPKQKYKNLKCSYCSYIAKWPSDLRRHLLVHSVEKRFKCTLCWKKYKYLGDLNVHMRRDHEVDPAEDIVPEKVTTIPIKKNSPSIFRCPACPYTTKWKAEMERHSHIHTEKKSYCCRLCDYQTYWRGDMGRHLYRHHPEHVSKESELSNYFEYNPERKAIKLKLKRLRETHSDTPECDEQITNTLADESINDSISDTLSLSDSLSTTSSRVTASKEDGKLFKCDHCSFTNYVPSRMRSHMDTHYNLKQFKCPVCGCRANWKYDIRKHMKQKHPDCTEDVQMLTRKEAKATIKHYMDTMPNIRRDHHLNADDQDEDIERKKPVVKKWRYKCSECVYCSQYRWSVSKHQRTVHQGQTCLSIIALRREDKGTENVIDGKSAENDSPDVRQPHRIAKQKQQSMPSDKSGKSKTADGDGKYMYECSECGKQGSSKGAIKKHYNYIHPNSEVRIIFLGDGTEFNYYTGLPVESPIKATNRSPVTSANQSSSSNPDIASPSRGGKLDSKLSNPKEHGYVKPFQCSVCGQRSNWKWDVKKHLRVKHAGMNGYVIVLQLDEARATYPGHQSSKISHTSYSDLDHPSPSKKLDVDKESMSSNSSILESSEASLQSCAMTYKKQEMMLGRFRRYKCSMCHYRSNWRTDVLRHIERRHGDRAQIIFMDVETAKQTFMDYDYQREVPGTGGQSINSHKSVSFRQSGKAAGQQLGTWSCPRCVFKSAVKTHIIRHMQSHGMKPFNCSVCGFTSRFRGPVYRHIRTQHKDVEYIKHARIIIKYAKSKLSNPALDIDPESTTAVYIDAFLCRLCNLESESKVTLLQHLKVKHSCCDPNQALQIRKRIRQSNSLDAESGNNYLEADDDETSSFEDSSGSKQYFCTICPYHSDKRSMLTFHHTYHQPSSQKKYKCKLCPYYVCAPRQLHQHMKWHSGSIEGSSTTISQENSTSWQNWIEKTPSYSPSKHPKFPLDASPKKHQCEKCPYTTNSKNDILYHKQFHRPKPAAEYKCELCDYWVTHRRLLKQHARLHGIHYSNGESESSLATSPNKSLASDASAVYDAVEIAAIKQKMIATKIMASLSTSPAVSPMKIATQCSVGNRPGFVLRNGAYHVLHRCRKCPYTNVRARNLRLHELMHGPRKADHPLMKCPYCDYYVGSKGLLSHHMKVHLHHYLPDPGDNSTYDLERSEGVAAAPIEVDDDAGSDAIESPEIPQKQKVDTLLEISRFKKYSCEKCPYASGKRAHFTRHMELHGSRQRHTCEYCDYSVPSGNLLTQHHKIHLMPNQNLLATQSFSNLQHMNEVPADVALASALPPTDSAEPVTISIIHDHLELYENDDANAMDLEPRKLYRCDRCPYANVRRDHLLTHLCFHLHLSTFQCPYCDYSAPKQQLLTQHIRVHFCPLPELADWLTENGQAERAQEVNDIDLTQALEVAEKFQSSPKRKLLDLQASEKKSADEGSGESGSMKKTKKSRAENSLPQNGITAKISKSQSSVDNKLLSTFTAEKMDGEQRVFEDDVGTSVIAQEMPHAEGPSLDSSIYICQYCDRELITSKRLISHEMQHLIGNHFEFASEATSKDGTPQTMSKIKENNEHVITVDVAQKEGIIGEEVKMQEKPNKAQTFELEDGNILLDHKTDSLKPSKPGKTEYKQLEDGINPPEPRMQIQTSTEESQLMTKGGSIEDS